jgi:hypothetical protein
MIDLHWIKYKLLICDTQNMIQNKRNLFIGFIVVSLSGTILTFIFNRNAPPVSALVIPDSTKEYFKNISDWGHTKFDWVDSIDLDKHHNNSNYSEGFLKLEGDNFIIYYRDSPKEKIRAEKTLQFANEAIPELAEFFGKYYYAREVNNRKLPVYLALTERDFAEISQALGGTSVDWAAGLTYNTFSSNGDKLCKGIILNSIVQENSSSDLKTVVYHEMAHYNHFQCMDLLKKPEYMNWEVEGLASFFANDWNQKIPDNINISNYSLLKDPDNYLDSYWMGYHAFHLAYELGKFRNIIQKSYNSSLKIAIPEAAECSFDHYDEKWRLHCNRIRYNHK